MPRYRIMTDNGPLAFVEAADEREALAIFGECFIVEAPEEWEQAEFTPGEQARPTTPLFLLREPLGLVRQFDPDGWTGDDTAAEIAADVCPHCGRPGFATGGCACDEPVDAWGRPRASGKEEVA